MRFKAHFTGLSLSIKEKPLEDVALYQSGMRYHLLMCHRITYPKIKACVDVLINLWRQEKLLQLRESLDLGGCILLRRLLESELQLTAQLRSE